LTVIRSGIRGPRRQTTDQVRPPEILRKELGGCGKDELAARAENTGDFGERRLKLVDVLEDAVAEDEVERRVTRVDRSAICLLDGLVKI